MDPAGTLTSRTGRRLIGAAAVGGVAAAVSLVGASGAVAADEYLQFSLDGQTYSSSVSGPIFDQALRYVPGGSSTATLWIRNNSDEPASLSSAAVIVRSATELDGYIGLQAGAGSDLSSRSALGSQGTCTNVGQVWDMDVGEELQLSFVADLSASAPNDTMNKDAEFDVVFLLESKAAGTDPRPACSALAVPEETLPGQTPPSGPAGNSGSPVSLRNENQPAQLAMLAGTAGTAGSAGAAAPSPSAFAIRAVGQEGSVPVGRYPAEGAKQETLATPGIVAAGFQSTVEPIIRSLSGTLLIAMSVVFSAAVVLRLRNRQA